MRISAYAAFYALVFSSLRICHFVSINTRLKRIRKLFTQLAKYLIFNKSPIHRQLIGFQLLYQH